MGITAKELAEKLNLSAAAVSMALHNKPGVSTQTRQLVYDTALKYGFDFSRLIDETFYEKTYVQNQILGRALLESIIFMDGKCVVSMVDKKTMGFYRADSHDLDGIVNQLRLTKGVECAIFMYQTDVLKYKVSLRSNGKVDVAKVAMFFGGGGHVRAAGADMQGTFHDIVNNLSAQIDAQLKTEKKA